MNNLVNTAYFGTWKRLPSFDLKEERGAEAIEWIAMVAVILIMLLALQPVFQRGGRTIGTSIVSQIAAWIAKFA